MKQTLLLISLFFLLSACTSNTSPTTDQTYQGYPCQNQCQQFQAGFDQAKEQGVKYASECTNGEDKFIVGCKAYAHEYQVEHDPSLDLHLE